MDLSTIGGGTSGSRTHWRWHLEVALMSLGLFAIKYSHVAVPTTSFLTCNELPGAQCLLIGLSLPLLSVKP